MKETKFIETMCRIKPHSQVTDTSPRSTPGNSFISGSNTQLQAIPYSVYTESSIIPAKGILNLRPRNPYCPDWTDGGNHLFAFDHVFGEDATQEFVYQRACEPMIKAVMEGYNGCILCYGQTNTGKTHTMCGGQQSDTHGLIPRCIASIFSELSSIPDAKLSVSYIEIYNECAYDLLANSMDPNLPIESWPRLTLRDDENGSLHIQGLSHHMATDFESVMDLFSLGNYNKMVSSTPMNLASSRSHCIFTIELVLGTRRSKLRLVDLAGSERVWKSKINGDNLKEARYINKSLHFLEQVVIALANSARHVPYRNSVLTNILRDSIGGNCRTCMIANISVSEESLKETLATCRFAQRCSQVRVDLSQLSSISTQKNEVPRILPSVPSIPIHLQSDKKFVFESLIGGSNESPTVRDLLDQSKANLTQFPRSYRTKLIERIRNDGLDVGPINCVGDLCAILQVLVAKLAQSDDEKRELKIEMEKMREDNLATVDNDSIVVADVSTEVKPQFFSSTSSVSSTETKPSRYIPVISINLSDYDKPSISPPQWSRARTHGSFEIPWTSEN